MGQIGRKMGEIWPYSWRFWRIFEAQMAKSPKTNLGTLILFQNRAHANLT